MHVLHILDPVGDGEEVLGACRSALETPVRHTVWMLGTGPDRWRASLLGLPDVDLVCSSTRPDLIVRRALGRLLSRRRASWGGGPDVVQAWGARSAQLMRRVVPSDTPIVAAMLRGPRTGEPGPDPSIVVVTPGDSLRRRWESVGVATPRTVPIGLPAVGTAGGPPRWERAALRAALGASDHQPIVALLASPARLGQARRFVFMLGLTHVGAVPTMGLVAGGAFDERRAARAMRSHHRRWMLRVTDVPLQLLLHAADLAVWDPGRDEIDPTGMPLLRQAAWTLPVSAPDTPMVRECVAGTPHDHRVVRSGTVTRISAGALRIAWRGSELPEPFAATEDETDHAGLMALWREVARVTPKPEPERIRREVAVVGS